MLYIFRGLPASGKSTSAQVLQQRLVSAGQQAVIIERDMIRDELTDGKYSLGDYDFDHETEKEVSGLQRSRVEFALKSGWSAIVSDTNLRDKYVRDFMRLAQKHEAESKIMDLRDVPLDLCLMNNRRRIRKVPENVIRDMHTRFIKGRNLNEEVKLDTVSKGRKRNVEDFSFDSVEKYVAPKNGKRTILLDVDGTIANHHGVRDPYDFTKYREDTPHLDVISIINALYVYGYQVIVFSGRHEDYREDLEWWLDNHNVPHDRVIMRERGEMRDDYEKLYLFEKYIRNDETISVQAVFDDRDRVVQNTWRTALGLRCFQVAPGDF